MRTGTGLVAMAAFGGCATVHTEKTRRPNILFITADDMNWDSPGCYGNKIPNITPNIDQLAAEGMRFTNAHVNIAVCQPSRQVLMTGRYPHRAGYEWFEPIADDVPTLQEQLTEGGYINGCIGKLIHLAPQERYNWSMGLSMKDLNGGRAPQAYYEHTKAFIEMAAEQNKPFFLMANSHDPHRPFHGSKDEEMWPEKWRRSHFKKPSRVYEAHEVQTPGFLPDQPEVREEIAQYYSSVRRCDDTVGEILRALRESGQEDNTLVMFISDNGMPFPFAKCCVYLNSTRTPWIVRWPGHVKPGVVNDRHFISGIDYMPTILEAVGLESVSGMDGTSFLSLLHGKGELGRDHVFTAFYTFYPVDGGWRPELKEQFQMRCVQNKRFGYIFNEWSNGEKAFGLSSTPLNWNAMLKAGETDPKWKERATMFRHRVPEEFYDFENDPDALNNLIDETEHQAEIGRMRRQLTEWMEQTEDKILPNYRKCLKRSPSV